MPERIVASAASNTRNMNWVKPSRTTATTAAKPIVGATNGTKPTKHAKSAALIATRTVIIVTGMATIATSVAIICIFAMTTTVIAVTAIMIVTAVVLAIGMTTDSVVQFGF